MHAISSSERGYTASARGILFDTMDGIGTCNCNYFESSMHTRSEDLVIHQRQYSSKPPSNEDTDHVL